MNGEGGTEKDSKIRRDRTEVRIPSVKGCGTECPEYLCCNAAECVTGMGRREVKKERKRVDCA